jgi:hypothetical protein
MYCYRFPSRQQFRTLAAAQGLITKDGELITASHTYSIDEIGLIYQGGTYDADGEVITPPTQLPGWHVNYVGAPPEAWDDFLEVVNSPARIFLGGATQVSSDDIPEAKLQLKPPPQTAADRAMLLHLQQELKEATEP